MISIIICSTKPDISSTLRENIRKTVGVEHEIIIIDNSQNQYSIFSAYNKGLEKSSYPYVCFIHQDVKFITSKWGEKLITHLSDSKVGVVGIAGGKIATKTPSSWSISGRRMNIVQHRHKGEPLHIRKPLNFSETRLPAIVIDGVFLSMRRDLFKEIKFDESFSGFHGYDYDICIQAKVAGYSNYVVYDILLEHFSEGTQTKQYYINLINIAKKWESRLPLLADDIPTNNQKELNKLETKALARLIRRMARIGFEKKEITETAQYYANITSSKKAHKRLKYINLSIWIQKTFKTKRS